MREDGKVVHKLRPVEAYILDEKGEPILKFDEHESLRTAQAWRLNRNTPGAAEMSANLGDLADAPEGDVAIDPSMTFSSNMQDTSLNSTTSGYLESFSYLLITLNYRALLGFNINSASNPPNEKLPAGALINKAKLEFYVFYNTLSSSAKYHAYKVTTHWAEAGVTYQYATPSSAWTNHGGDFSDPNYQSRQYEFSTSSNGWMQMDVTQTFKSHLISSQGDVHTKGFMLKMNNNSPSGQIRMYSKEYGDGSMRPKLVVEYGATEFGADCGYGWDPPNPPGWTASLRMNNMKNDKMYITRYVISTDDAVYGNFKNYLAETPSGVKVIPIFNTDLGDSPNNYGSFVMNILSDNDVSPYISNGTILAVELASESEAVFGKTYQGGLNLASYYVNARNAIKDQWPDLEIISGGSIEDHRHFSSCVNFLNGFIDGATQAAINANDSRFDYLPETFAIHAYMGHYSPEYRNSGSETDWFKRLSELHKVCDTRGYIPNYAITEHGYSPISATQPHVIGNVWAPVHPTSPYNADTYPYIAASSETQAIYYLRSSLMNAVMSVKDVSGNSLDGIGWKYSIYHHHPRDHSTYSAGGQLWWYDFGFHQYDNYPGSDRPIRYIARNLHDPSGSIQIGIEGTILWAPLQNSENDNDKLAWCGWETSSGQKWGAIWRYLNDGNRSLW